MGIKVGSLFSGIGGIDLGLQWAGMKTIWFVENEPYCQKVLAKHWPGVPCYGDIKTVDFRTLPRPDLLCGGFPCQPFSVAGKRQGTADDRWLWPEFYRAICEIKPRLVLAENVPGLLSIESGRLFGGILRDLAESGYDAEWDVLSAAEFGAPHLRQRLFIVGYANVADAHGKRCDDSQKRQKKISIFGCKSSPRNVWSAEPNVGRVAHGISSRMDRLKALGNAVVPRVAEWIGERIIKVEEGLICATKK